MPFLDHLEELRWRILYSLLAIVVGTLVGWFVVQRVDVIGLLKAPIAPLVPGGRLMFTSPTEPFFITLKFAFALGLLVASPVVIYQAWAFLAPALYDRERRLIVPALSVGVVLFLLGAGVAYKWVLPRALAVLFSFQRNDLAPIITADNYFGFAAQIMIAFGLVTELPLVVVILAALGLVTPQFLPRNPRYALGFAAFDRAGGRTRDGSLARAVARHRGRPAARSADRSHAQLPAGRRRHGFAAQAEGVPRHAVRRRHADRPGRQPDDLPSRGKLRGSPGDEAGSGFDPLSRSELPSRRRGRPAAVRSGHGAGGGGDALRYLHPAGHGPQRAHHVPARRRHLVHAGRSRRGLGLDPRVRRLQRDHVLGSPRARLPLRRARSEVAQQERHGGAARRALHPRCPDSVVAVHLPGHPARAAQRHSRAALRAERPGAPDPQLPAARREPRLLLGARQLRRPAALGRLVCEPLRVAPRADALPLVGSLSLRHLLVLPRGSARRRRTLEPFRVAAPAELLQPDALQLEHRLRDERE